MKTVRTVAVVLAMLMGAGLWGAAWGQGVDWSQYKVDYFKNGKKVRGAELDAIKTTDGIIIINGTSRDSLSIFPARRGTTAPAIPLVSTDASLRKLYTQVTIDSLQATSGVIESINADKSYVGKVNATAVGDVFMSARTDSAAATSPTFAVTSIVGSDQPASVMTKPPTSGKDGKIKHPSKIQMRGVILQDLNIPSQDVLWVNVETKQYSGALSLAGIGPVEVVKLYTGKGEATTPSASIVAAKSIKNIFVFGGPVVCDSMTGEIRNISTQGKLLVASTKIPIAGDFAPAVLRTEGLNFRIDALGGDIKPALLYSSGNIFRLMARKRLYSAGSGVGALGGRLGFSSDVADAGTTPTAPTSYTMHVIVEKGSIQKLDAAFGIYGLFIAGWDKNKAEPDYSGAISMMSVSPLRGATFDATTKLGIWGGACIKDVWKDDLIKHIKGDKNCVKDGRFAIFTEKNPL